MTSRQSDVNWKALADGVAWIFFLVAGIAFWAGGRALHEVFGTDRVLAEMEGIGITVISCVLGFIARAVGERLESGSEAEDSTTASS